MQRLHVATEEGKALVGALIDEASPFVLLATRRATGSDEPAPIGILARVLKSMGHVSGNFGLAVSGLARARIGTVSRDGAFPRASAQPVPPAPEEPADRGVGRRAARARQGLRRAHARARRRGGRPRGRRGRPRAAVRPRRLAPGPRPRSARATGRDRRNQRAHTPGGGDAVREAGRATCGGAAPEGARAPRTVAPRARREGAHRALGGGGEDDRRRGREPRAAGREGLHRLRGPDPRRTDRTPWWRTCAASGSTRGTS